ncbi:MAG TPA: hypothetical protein VGV60_17045 [Candidatus Polarisedimenticolia bacterium]|jgi:hypothetical protein|nr:hypothetical protein [Candidatus Polarisedimenticolia bacterium]
MCLILRLEAAFLVAIGLAGGAMGRTAAAGPPKEPVAGPSAAVDSILPLLTAEDYDETRPRILEALRQFGAPCRSLGAYASSRSTLVREHAVRALSDAGCADFAAYEGFAADGDAWVIDAIIRAAGKHLIAGAVPFLLARLSDSRRILADEGTWTIGDTAHRGLQAITCQSFHYDAAASADDRRNALTRWRQWYLAHRDEPREAWVREGIDRAREYAARDYGPHRLEGLRLLALIGEPALPALRALLGRTPGDLSAEVSCLPEEPPRPPDQVPCVLLVRNVTDRKVAFAPPQSGPEVRVTRQEPPEADGAPARPGKATASRPAPAPPEPPVPVDPRAALAALAARLVELSPGEVRRYDFAIGPVPAPGRYEVRASLPDSALTPGAGPASMRAPGTIEVKTVVRFDM